MLILVILVSFFYLLIFIEKGSLVKFDSVLAILTTDLENQLVDRQLYQVLDVGRGKEEFLPLGVADPDVHGGQD